jgi:aminoglycoside phosphotransferase (APT) family kinase protein/O-antigen/teichoic acid export membrane protein
MYRDHRFISGFTAHLSTPLYRNAYALMLNSLTSSALGVGYWILAAHNYSTATVGLNSAAISAMMFLAGVAQLNLTSAELRFIPSAGPKTARFVASAYLISISIAVAVCIVFIWGLDIWAPTLGALRSNPFLATWFTLSTMAWCIFVLQDSALIGLRQAIWVPLENTAFAFAKIALLIGLAAWIPRYGLFASWSIGMALTLLPINALIFRRLIPRHMAKATDHIAPFIATQVIKYVAADYVGSLCWLASTSLLPLMITQQAGATANAYFFLSWQIAYLLFLLCGNMASSLLVEAVNDPGNRRAYTYRTCVQIVRTVVPAAVILAVGAPYLLRVFGTNYAEQAAWPLRLLALSAIPYIINCLYVTSARIQRHMRTVVALALISCALVLGLSHIFLQVYGIKGVGLAWLVSQTLIAAALLCTPELRPLWLPRRSTAGLIGISAKIADGAGPSADSHGGEASDLGKPVPWSGAGRLRWCGIQVADWVLGALVTLRLLPLLRRVQDYRVNRHRLTALSDLVPDILQTLMPLSDASQSSQWLVYRSFTTVTDMTVVSIGPPNQPPKALLKLAATRPAIKSLRRQIETLEGLRADVRIGEWSSVLPTILAAGEIDGRAYMVEQMLPGRDARLTLANPDDRARMLVAASSSIGELHRRTATCVVVDAGMIEQWINEPLEVIRRSYAALPEAAKVNQATVGLAKELYEALTGRSLCISWVHGDFTPGNILTTLDGSVLTGIVDWDQAAPAGLPLLDLLLLLLSVRMVVERRELGDVVRSLLMGAGWTPHEQALIDISQAALPGDKITWRSLVLLCWLRHVLANLTKSTRTGGSLWARRNIQVVLQCL